MTFGKLNEQEFKNFIIKHPKRTFFQTIEWGRLKANHGWQMELLGIKKKNQVIGAAMLLSKQTVLRKKIYYIPRGPLIDYHNMNLLVYFTEELKTHVRQNGGFLLKIDPYFIYKERDNEGKLVNGGINNKLIINNLIVAGYIHLGFTKKLGETIQPRWNVSLDLANKSTTEILNAMDQPTRWTINKVRKIPFIVKELELEEIDKFKKIMTHTSQRRTFFDRSLTYYENMYKELKKSEMIKILIAELNVDKYLTFLDDDLKGQVIAKEEIVEKLNKIPQSKKYRNQQKVIDEALALLTTKKNEAYDLKRRHGNNIPMAGAIFILYGDEISYLFSGAYGEFMYFNAQYRIQWEIIKYGIEHKYTKYNFMGINGNFSKEDELYGLYKFKKGFGGYVEELIGEFDLPVNKTYYWLYKFLYKLYKLWFKLIKKQSINQ